MPILRAGLAGVRAKVPEARLIARAVEGGDGEGAGGRDSHSHGAGARVNELPHLHGVDVSGEVCTAGQAPRVIELPPVECGRSGRFAR